MGLCQRSGTSLVPGRMRTSFQVDTAWGRGEFERTLLQRQKNANYTVFIGIYEGKRP